MTVQHKHLQQVADSFRAIAEVRAAGGYAPIYQQMAAGVATDPELLTIAAAAQPGQNPPSLLLGAAQYLVADHPDHPLIRFYPILTGQQAPGHDPYPALRDFVLAQHEQITQLVATHLVQTNEPARSAYLYPALLTAQHLGSGQPLALIEVGSSAGLTLVPDRYSYNYGAAILHGDSTSPLRLHCALRGSVSPPLDGSLRIVWRTGIDLHPLNLGDTADRRWLRALIWPDHPDRAERLDLAARAAARGPLPHIHQGDAAECLPELVAQAPEDATVVVFHTAVLAHFTQQARTAFEQRLHEVSAQRPITWIQGEPRPDQQPRLRLAQLNDGRLRADHPLGRYHPHGAWLEWVASLPGASVGSR